MNRIIIAVVAVIVIGGAAIVFTKDKGDSPDQAPASQTGANGENGVGNPASSDSAQNPLDPNGYTDGADIGDTLDATDKSEVNISIDDYIFKTTYLKIKKGTKVTWTNEGQISHDVISADDSPKKGLSSELLNNGGTYSFTFSEAGLYEYFCTPHPVQMRGVITVVD